MKNCRIVIFVTKCTEKVVKSLYFHGKIAVFQNPLVRARGNLSLGPCFSGCPEPNGPQKIYEILAGRIEASKVICPAVRAGLELTTKHISSKFWLSSSMYR